MPWKLVRLRILTLLRLVLTPSVTLKTNQHVGFALMAEIHYIYIKLQIQANNSFLDA